MQRFIVVAAIAAVACCAVIVTAEEYDFTALTKQQLSDYTKDYIHSIQRAEPTQVQWSTTNQTLHKHAKSHKLAATNVNDLPSLNTLTPSPRRPFKGIDDFSYDEVAQIDQTVISDRRNFIDVNTEFEGLPAMNHMFQSQLDNIQPSIAVGRQYILQAYGQQVMAINKQTLQSESVGLSSDFFMKFPSQHLCRSIATDGDVAVVRVLYDEQYKRFILALRPSTISQAVCIAVSGGEDVITGEWSSTFFETDVYYDLHIATFGTSFIMSFADVNAPGNFHCFAARVGLGESGSALTPECVYVDGSLLFPSQAATVIGKRYPPHLIDEDQMPVLLVGALDTSNLALFQFDVVHTTTMVNNVPTIVSSVPEGSYTFLPVAPFSPACQYYDEPGVKNDENGCPWFPSGVAEIRSSAYKLSKPFWRITDGGITLVTSHTVTVHESASIRWYQITLDFFQTKVVGLQQGSYLGPDHRERFVPSIISDRYGSLILGYHITSGNQVNPSLAMTGRDATDPQGLLQQDAIVFAAPRSQIQDQPEKYGKGEESEDGTIFPNWPSESAIDIDPSDDCTVYFTGSYMGFDDVYYQSRIIRKRFAKQCKY